MLMVLTYFKAYCLILYSFNYCYNISGTDKLAITEINQQQTEDIQFLID